MEPGTYQTLKLVQYIIGIRTETIQRNEVHYIRGIEVFICLFIFDYRALFVYVKDRTIPAIPTFCFNIRCLVLFLDRKLI